ncbi:hypothetical protein OUZ56_012066 [Daphnia magna]|uniref:HAT C-terminal dimerisation domain-containing protein n=1 Tax=Daphnia magna TaxID=35525 RepID=A0ABQ9Z242_9CRUS|nr:hypothetical protein OUZ56_012066 [Daphnia magna]
MAEIYQTLRVRCTMRPRIAKNLFQHSRLLWRNACLMFFNGPTCLVLLNQSSKNSTTNMVSGFYLLATKSSDTERQPPQDQEKDIVGPTAKKKSRSLYSTVIEPRRSSSVGSSKALEELEIYFNEPTLPMKEIRPLEFWRLNSHRFPVLSPIARDIFGIRVIREREKSFQYCF